MDLSVFIVTLFILQLTCFWVATKASKNLATQQDYFLAGKNVGFFPLMMTFVATQVGGGLILGSTEEAYRFGWTVLLYPLGQCLGFVLLAAGIGRKMSQFGVSTVAQLFEVVYKSTRLRKAASILSILSLFFIFVAQIIASKKFMISVGVDYKLIFMGFWGIVILYTVLGGLQAVVATDVIQALFFIVVFIFCFVYALNSTPTAWGEVVNAGLQGEGLDLNAARLCSWLLMPLLFMVIEQDMAQRCFAAKSGKVVSRAAGVAAVCTFLICLIPVYFGIFGQMAGIQVSTESSVLMTVIQSSTSPIMAALVGCAILAAIISTADSLINAISSNLTQDFGFTSHSIRTSQKITAGIALAGVLISYSFDNVVDLLIQSYELSVSCLFIPVFAALFKKHGNVASALGAITLGALSFCLFRYVTPPIPREIMSLIFSLSGFCLGEAFAFLQSRQTANALHYINHRDTEISEKV